MLPDLEQTLLAHADAARALHAAATEDERQTIGAKFAVDLIPGCHYAGLIQRRRRGTVNAAATDQLVRLADDYGNEQRSGPGIEALDQEIPVVSADLQSEPRWVSWTHYAHRTLGLGAVISLPLEGSSRSFGALTLYFDRPIPAVESTLAMAQAYATHLTLALACGLTIEHQTAALEHRTAIGQAQGILMSNSRLTPDTAFAYLQRISQHSNRKLRDIAAEVVRTRGPLADPSTSSRDRKDPATDSPLIAAVPTDAAPTIPANVAADGFTGA